MSSSAIPSWRSSCESASSVASSLHSSSVRARSATRIRVWDSTAELRYLVLPMRPPGTDGWSEERLAALVTRDSMIGTGLALSPEGMP